MGQSARRAPARILTLLLALGLAPLAGAQSFHATASSKADTGAWRKLELWKDQLIHEANQDQVQVIMDHEVKIRSGSSAALAEIRNLVAGEDGEMEMVTRIMDSEYVALELGYFDLYYPIWFLQKKSKVKELQRCTVALLDLQGKFLDWVGLAEAARASEVSEQPAVRTMLSELRDVYGSWKPRALARSALDEAHGRYEKFNALPESRAFADYMRQQLWMEPATSRKAPPVPEQVARPGLHVIMAGDWQNFTAMACGFALMDEIEEVKEDGQRIADFVWFDKLPVWTYFYWYQYHEVKMEHYQVMGSEYATTDVGDVWGLETPGAKMDEVTDKKSGLEQHLVQHISERFMQANFNSRMHLAIQNGMATDLVFEIYDENREKSSGSGVANQTQAYSVFIPGGASQGGTLPAISAENRVRRGWKPKKGEGGDRYGYFLSHQLGPGEKVAKKQLGKKRVKDNPYYFAIEPEDKNLDKRVLYPPLFATSEMETDEFFRAYKVYFAAWLRTQAGAGPGVKAKDARGPSEAAFARLLLTTARKAKEIGPSFDGDTVGSAPFMEALVEIYGMPLTGDDLIDSEHPNLEGRCLETLK